MKDDEQLPQGIRDPHLPDLLTVAEVATLLRVSRMTVYRLIHTGELSAIRLGRTFRIPTHAVRTIMDGDAPGAGPADDDPPGRPPTA
jgi:excisionase family DNA binding protein